MRRRDFIIGLGVAATRTADAQQGVNDQDVSRLIIGTWIFVSSYTIHEDGRKSDRWGPGVNGILIFDGQGHFAQSIMRPASRLLGARTFSVFGTYNVDTSANTIVTAIEGSSMPRAVGLVQRRIIVSVTEQELRYINLQIVSGDKIEVAWRRPS